MVDLYGTWIVNEPKTKNVLRVVVTTGRDAVLQLMTTSGPADLIVLVLQPRTKNLTEARHYGNEHYIPNVENYLDGCALGVQGVYGSKDFLSERIFVYVRWYTRAQTLCNEDFLSHLIGTREKKKYCRHQSHDN